MSLEKLQKFQRAGVVKALKNVSKIIKKATKNKQTQSGIKDYLRAKGVPNTKETMKYFNVKGLSPQIQQSLKKFKTETMSQEKLRKLNELKANPKWGSQLDEGGDILRMGGQVSAIRSDWVKHK